MKYKEGQKVYVWRGNIKGEIKEATITGYSGKASFGEDVYEFDYYINNKMKASSGAGESDIFETLQKAQLAKFKMAKTIREYYFELEKVMAHYKEIMTKEMQKLLPE